VSLWIGVCWAGRNLGGGVKLSWMNWITLAEQNWVTLMSDILNWVGVHVCGSELAGLSPIRLDCVLSWWLKSRKTSRIISNNIL
jgi:hypothetical protein